MREIKFRCWNFENEQWETDFVVFPDGEGAGYTHCCKLSFEYLINQFTGLLDKNGIEIYEGDIIDIPGSYNHGGLNLVEFEEQGGLSCAYILGYPAVLSKGHIVGNKYENPELLEK